MKFTIAPDVFWVGKIDWELRKFHGEEYTTRRGSSYNSYLVKDEKTALIDTVWGPFAREFVENLKKEIDLREIDYVIANHAETDHSGALPELMRHIPGTPIYCTANGVKSLKGHYHKDWNFHPVKTGDKLSLGGKELIFVEAPMLHWPDSMFSYLPSRRILVSQDAFGMHLASSETSAHRIDPALLREEAGRYYANILLPYSQLVSKLLERVSAMDLGLDIIAPDHGPAWFAGTETGPGFITELYGRWAAQAPTLKAVVAYDTMWGSTGMMAGAIAAGLREGGANPVVHPLHGSHRSDVAADLLEAGALVLGTPTINGSMFPTMADLVAYLGGLRRRNLVGAAFGSHGWSGEGVGRLSSAMSDMKIDLLHPGLASQFRPGGDVLASCRELGLGIAGRLRREVG